MFDGHLDKTRLSSQDYSGMKAVESHPEHSQCVNHWTHLQWYAVIWRDIEQARGSGATALIYFEKLQLLFIFMSFALSHLPWVGILKLLVLFQPAATGRLEFDMRQQVEPYLLCLLFWFRSCCSNCFLRQAGSYFLERSSDKLLCTACTVSVQDKTKYWCKCCFNSFWTILIFGSRLSGSWRVHPVNPNLRALSHNFLLHPAVIFSYLDSKKIDARSTSGNDVQVLLQWY